MCLPTEALRRQGIARGPEAGQPATLVTFPEGSNQARRTGVHERYLLNTASASPSVGIGPPPWPIDWPIPRLDGTGLEPSHECSKAEISMVLYFEKKTDAYRPPYAVICIITLPPPALSPAIVTSFGSPPKVAICR